LVNPFSVLGLADAFDVDMPALEKTHRELSRALHPDRYAQAPSGERRAALERAVEVNEAFRAVRDPLTRAERLFVLRGVPVGDGHEPKPDSTFLMDVLEKREALSDAKDAKDATKIRALGEEARAEEARVLASLSKAFSEPKNALAKHLGLLGELRFFRRFIEEVSAVEDELDHAS
jgi:molecular chaperone HscB